jgi:hypothetical protein
MKKHLLVFSFNFYKSDLIIYLTFIKKKKKKKK